MNQTHVNKNQTHFKKKKKKSNPSNDQTQETEPINPSTKQAQIKPIKTTHPPLRELNFRQHRIGLSSSALRWRRTDVGGCGPLFLKTHAFRWVRSEKKEKKKEVKTQPLHTFN